MSLSRRDALALLGGLPAITLTTPGWALDYPTRFVRIVIPYLPGGSAEAVARMIGQQLHAQWDQPVIVETKPGAGTTIGAAYIAHSAPDGYTLYIASTSHTISQSLYKTLNYDTIKSFAPVSLLARSPFLIVVNGKSDMKSLADLVALAKSKPGALNFGTSGTGGSTHLAAELFMMRAGISAVHIPFNGAPPSLSAVMGDQVQFTFADISSIGLVKSGALRCLGVTTLKRSSKLPDVPTFDEQGFKGYEVTNWSSVIAPAGTPPEIVSFINASMKKALETKPVQEIFDKQGFDVAYSTPDELKAFMVSEVAKYEEILKHIGLYKTR
ncbi:MAG TPA: tripartite tricarboxylate transporter substrate binding protein [Pseudolabrys sp.]|nr:tripartite tricarboxylate transporter substrate binding protein [Pseudolabrys sp.]